MKAIKIILAIIFILLLTFLTQIGGIAYLISLASFGQIEKKVALPWRKAFVKLFSFLLIYFIFTLVLVPLVAPSFGRVPLPLFEKNHLQPTNLLTCLLNRNYVKPELRRVAFKVAQEINQKYPGVTINYLDANFPFLNKFPLFPHLSHNDGRKLDLSFQYNRAVLNQATNAVPSWIGYGICEEPKDGEENMAAYCASQGYWQYGWLRTVIPQTNKAYFRFNELRTKELVNAFASEKAIDRIFIEPHLKKRLKLTSDKILFHGCHAVRHDDHIHVQLK